MRRARLLFIVACIRDKRRRFMATQVDTLIFDMDDTLYPQDSGFSEHRNQEVALKFMVERLGFESREKAGELRNEYFRKYHSTLKGLTVADQEGRLSKKFDPTELAEYWAENCRFSEFLKPNATLAADLKAIKNARLLLFTNGPRKYGLKCLDALGLRELFPDENVIGVEDVMPHCKPEPEAFFQVLNGIDPSRAVMFEDSMKNIRTCKSIGMHTVLIDNAKQVQGEAALLGDHPVPDDPAVAVVLPTIDYLRAALPSLWHDPATFPATTTSTSSSR